MKFVPIGLFILAWICAFIDQHHNPGPFINYLMSYIMLLSVGVGSLIRFLGLCFCPDKMAGLVGEKPSIYQYHLGIVSLAIGVLGVLSFVYVNLWLATGIMVSIILLGSVYGYVLHLIRNKGAASCMGIISFANLVVAITLIVGLYMIHMH